MGRFRFTLYVAGDTARSQQAYADLRRICEERLGGDFEIEVVDVAADADAAEAARILTTPTVVKNEPTPPRRITGDLSHPDKVLAGLGILPGWPSVHPGSTQ
jgi:circadian clock protein KaiB